MAIITSTGCNLLDSLREMENTENIMFYLTGSRLFGTASNNSDWDFFVQDSEESREWLVRHEFVPENSHPAKYTDELCTGVYIHREHPIHVQLVRDAREKRTVQGILYHSPLYRKASKEDRRLLWNLVVEARGRYI